MPIPAAPFVSPARIAAFLLLLAIAVCALDAPAVRAASRAAVRAANGMVVTPEERATQVGVQVLRSGGNAVDAAVAVAFALAVTFPTAGNLGGGGFLLRRAPGGEHAALDFRETAPRRLAPSMFLDAEGRPVPGRSLRGGLAVGVPGSVAGLAEAHRRWGSLKWSDLVAPAISLADRGFSISRSLGEELAKSGRLLREDESARKIFTRDGELLGEGQRLVQKDLAASLRRIARFGPAGFYRGSTADSLVLTVKAAGGVLDAADLTRYRPIAREPLEGRYRGWRVICFPPPSSGGVVLLQVLGMLERFELRRMGAGSSAAVHLMAEAERRAYADRSRWLGDPDFYEVPTASLLDSAYLAQKVASIRDDQATPSAQVQAGELDNVEPPETLHFSVADPSGGAVALTTTLNETFGSGIVARGTGILLNNEIDDFALAPGIPNVYGLVGGKANAIAGGKRPLSSMTPTIVEFPAGGPRPALVLGSPGGSTIITSVLQVLVNVIDHEMPLQEAVDAPRFHHQWLPDQIRHEIRAFPADVALALSARGHELKLASELIGDVNAIGVDEQGRWLGAPDPRRHSTALGF